MSTREHAQQAGQTGDAAQVAQAGRQEVAGPGVTQLEALGASLASGSSAAIAAILNAFPGERDAMVAYLQRNYGNAFTSSVVEEDGLTLDIDPLTDAARDRASVLAEEVGVRSADWNASVSSLDAAGKLRVRVARAVALAPACAACDRVLDAPLNGAVCAACWSGIVPARSPHAVPADSPLASWAAAGVSASLVRAYSTVGARGAIIMPTPMLAREALARSIMDFCLSSIGMSRGAGWKTWFQSLPS